MAKSTSHLVYLRTDGQQLILLWCWEILVIWLKPFKTVKNILVNSVNQFRATLMILCI